MEGASYTLTLTPEPPRTGEPPAALRVRALLKVAKRGLRLKCSDIREAIAGDKADRAMQAGGNVSTPDQHEHEPEDDNMAAFNRVILMGNLTRDPQLKHLASQTAVVEFGLAVNRPFKTQAGEQKEEVTFVDCTAFGKTGEVINEYFTKGKPIFIEGWLKFDTWDDKGGAGKRSKLSVVVESVQFVGGRDGGDGADQRQTLQRRLAEKNDYNLNISRYVSNGQKEAEIDLAATHAELLKIEKDIHQATTKHNEFLKELGLSPLP